MTRTVSVNDSNDMYLDPFGNIALAFDLQAVLQQCEQVARTRLGEMIYFTNQGIPFMETVWAGVPNLTQFNAALRSAFLAVDGVVEVVSLITSQDDNTLNYTALIRTIYGNGSVADSINPF